MGRNEFPSRDRKIILEKTIDFYNASRYINKGLKNRAGNNLPPSSRGLGHLPFTEATGIRIPLGV